MTPIELLALVFSVLVLVKLIVALVKPKARINVAKKVYSNPMLISIVFLVLALICGYFIFAELSVVQVAAVMLFTSLLIGLTYAPYSQAMIKVFEEIPLNGKQLFKKNWISIIIFVAISLWVIYLLFA
ncbi:MAG: hypothetical protein Q7S21_06375 [archaeon]|nr:hypothetical protein [archaeon]